jgi:hypothetical protein
VNHNVLNVKYSNKDKSQEGAETFQQKVTSVAKKSLSFVHDASQQHSLTVASADSKCTAEGVAPTVNGCERHAGEEVRDFQ